MKNQLLKIWTLELRPRSKFSSQGTVHLSVATPSSQLLMSCVAGDTSPLTLGRVSCSLVFQVGGVANACFFSWFVRQQMKRIKSRHSYCLLETELPAPPNRFLKRCTSGSFCKPDRWDVDENSPRNTPPTPRPHTFRQHSPVGKTFPAAGPGSSVPRATKTQDR